MKRTIIFLAAIAYFAVSSVYAAYEVADEGTWPNSWPAELEPLRKHSRSLFHSSVAIYEIPFGNRKVFESAWPHILKLKTKEAPIILLGGASQETWWDRPRRCSHSVSVDGNSGQCQRNTLFSKTRFSRAGSFYLRRQVPEDWPSLA